MICSPAFLGAGNHILKKKGQILIDVLQGIPTLFIETQHGYARYNTGTKDPWGKQLREYFDTLLKNIGFSYINGN